MQFSDECKYSPSGFVKKHTVRVGGSESLNKVNQVPNNGASVMVCASYRENVVGPYLFENKNVTGDTFKWLRYSAIRSLRENPEDTIFIRVGCLHSSSFLCVSTWNKSSQPLNGKCWPHFMP